MIELTAEVTNKPDHTEIRIAGYLSSDDEAMKEVGEAKKVVLIFDEQCFINSTGLSNVRAYPPRHRAGQRVPGRPSRSALQEGIRYCGIECGCGGVRGRGECLGEIAMDREEIAKILDAGRAHMFRQMYLDWGEKKLEIEFADEVQRDHFVEFMKTQIEIGNIAQHFYDEGWDLKFRLELTEKGNREVVLFQARMN